MAVLKTEGQIGRWVLNVRVVWAGVGLNWLSIVSSEGSLSLSSATRDATSYFDIRSHRRTPLP